MKGLFGHPALKIWSVVLAVMLWMIVAGEETVERGLRVPLELQQFPGGLELQTDAPSLVDVRVRGSSGMLSRLGPGDIVAVIDLRSARPGRRLFQLTPEQVRVPFGVQVTQIAPTGLALTFEGSASRDLPVAPSIEGNPAPGYVVGKVVVDPARVEIVGPQSAVERASEAITEPISVSGADADVTEELTVGFADPTLRLKSPRLARVTVQILPGPVERELAGHPIHLRDLGAGLAAEVMPPNASLVLRGTRQGVSSVSSDEVTAYVDLGGLGAGEYVLPVRADSPQDAGVARINPASVKVRITRGQH